MSDVVRRRHLLSPEQEKLFKNWYGDYSQRNRLNPNPDDPLHLYDYRGWWNAFQENPDLRPVRDPYDGFEHGPSLFKDPDHPTMWMEQFFRMTGRDPNSLGIRNEKEAWNYLRPAQQPLAGK